MADRYARRILTHVADRRYAPSTVRELIDELSIPDDHATEFTATLEQLLEAGQVVRGTADTIALPPPGRDMIGTFRRHEKGFGFLVPDQLTEHGDLFIPPGNVGDAMTGDKVKARVIHEKGRGGGDSTRSPYIGRIVEVIQRADKAYSGTLVNKSGKHFVEVDGRIFNAPVLIRDITAKNAKVGDKVVIDLTEYPDDSGTGAEGVITEVLGEAGEPEVETLAVMRAYGLTEKFPPEVVQQAREAAQKLDDSIPADREDLTNQLICTIDPPDAKDYDDAISIRRIVSREVGERESGADASDGGMSSPTSRTPTYDSRAAWELGVHIADVAAYVTPGSALDEEAYARGNSTYLPRKVIPMLPEVLSNGVCSLMEGVNRFAKTVFLQYDAEGHVVGQRFARTVIRSAKRLTYLEAQALIDDDVREARKHCKSEANYPRELIQALKLMNDLSRTIRERRKRDGMIVLGLPAVQLIYDDSGRVVDAEPEDNAYTHTLIEMFMVEANEAAARVFSAIEVPMIRRVHPDPDTGSMGDLRAFARVAGYNIPAKPSRHELQALLDAVRDKPAQQAVHMAVLKTLSKAEYSPQLVGHFALASEHYTHFTSPIRRYPDFVVHRALDVYLEHMHSTPGGKPMKARQLGQAMRDDDRIPDEEGMARIGKHCSTTERNSEAAERELRNYLVLELLSTKLGEDFPATITGLTGQGVYMQIDRYLVDGFIRLNDLPGDKADRWQLNRNTGALVAQRSGRIINIGDRFTVRVANVDLAKRKMELAIIEKLKGDAPGNAPGNTAGKKLKPVSRFSEEGGEPSENRERPRPKPKKKRGGESKGPTTKKRGKRR